MKPIKYVIMLLAIWVTFSGVAEAKVISRRTTGKSSSLRRERERREKRERELRAKALEKAKKEYKKRMEIAAKQRKARIAAAEAAEQEKREKREEALNKKLAEERQAAKDKAMLGEYELMAKEVRMSSAQRTKMLAMVREFRGLPPNAKPPDKNAELAKLKKAYESATGTKKKLLAQKLEEARKRPESSSASKKAPKVSREQQHKKIMGLLTATQKGKWGGYKLAKDPALQFEGVTFTASQLKRIRAICDTAAKGLPDEASDMDPEAAAKMRKTVLKKVRVQIIYEVLTPAQRAAALS